MLVLKKIIIVFFVAFLTSCASNNQSWYRHQGVNFTECGPAVSASAMSFAGISTSVGEARAYNINRLFWRLTDIYEYLDAQGINPKWKLISDEVDENTVGVFYTGSHFVTQYDGKIYDPLLGLAYPEDYKFQGSQYIQIGKKIIKQ